MITWTKKGCTKLNWMFGFFRFLLIDISNDSRSFMPWMMQMTFIPIQIVILPFSLPSQNSHINPKNEEFREFTHRTFNEANEMDEICSKSQWASCFFSIVGNICHCVCFLNAATKNSIAETRGWEKSWWMFFAFFQHSDFCCNFSPSDFFYLSACFFLFWKCSHGSGNSHVYELSMLPFWWLSALPWG